MNVSHARPTFGRTSLDRYPRWKTRIALRSQAMILDFVGRLPLGSRRSRLFCHGLRRLVGGVLWSVKLEVNNACDLACRMCYANKGDDALSRDTIERMLDDLAGVGTRLEILGGEPLLRADLEEIIRYAKRQAHIPQVVLYTSAYHADAERVDRLKAAGLDIAIVNLVSCQEDEHDAFVGVAGAWQRTTAGIELFMRAGIETYTFTAVHAANIDRISEIYRFAKQTLGAHALFYQYIPQRKNDPLIPSRKEWARAKHFILCEKNVSHARFVRNFCTLAGTACSGGYFVFTVKVDGTVTPCPFISDIVLGNITQDSIWSIMRHRFSVERFVEFQSLPAECRACTYADICNGGCKAGNAELFGAYSHIDNRCLGPWDAPTDEAEVADRLPCFF